MGLQLEDRLDERRIRAQFLDEERKLFGYDNGRNLLPFAFEHEFEDVALPHPEDSDVPPIRLRGKIDRMDYDETTGNLVVVDYKTRNAPSWNDIEFRDNFRNGPAGAGTAIEIENSLAIRPGVNVTFTVAPRWAVVAFGGYMWNRPDTFYRDTNGVEIRDRWKADAVSVSIAAVYSLF